MKRILSILCVCLYSVGVQAHPVKDLLERIDKGASHKFILELVSSDTPFFELDQKGKKVVVRADSYVDMAAGVNWYLKYHAGVHLSWDCMKASLPSVLPPVAQRERHSTHLGLRYYLNYCTYSYSAPFWDWERWEREIDWMALHGVDMPLVAVGLDAVWRSVLLRLGYTEEEAGRFIAGPAFQAWWLMNNLEGWGGPNPAGWYDARRDLASRMMERMREWGMSPVLPGYAGMLPHDAGEKLGVELSSPGLWNGYQRPAILQPQDANFARIAGIYYEELEKVFGKVPFYSMDPFHEGGSVEGVDLPAVGRSILSAMKAEAPDARWVVQAWGNCPYDDMIRELPAGDMVVLDLFSESRPQWGDPASTWYRPQGFRQHSWIYCMLLNFGGNVGLHGKMSHVIDEFYKARESAFGSTLEGVGLTMEGMGNNPVMFELLSELPWREERFTKEEWLDGYIRARYGKDDAHIAGAWRLLSGSIYDAPASSTQQGTHESIFCARPTMDFCQVSSWSEVQDYYRPEDVESAAGEMLAVAPLFRGNAHYEYDLVDIVRQAVAEKGRVVYRELQQAYRNGDSEAFRRLSGCFLGLILQQDSLLATLPGFKVGSWLESARSWGNTEAEKNLYEWNARVQVTTWGNRTAAENGGLRDYAHKEWSGLLRDVYYPRWERFFSDVLSQMAGGEPSQLDFYAMDEAWTLRHNSYPVEGEGDPVETARKVFEHISALPYGQLQRETREVLPLPGGGVLLQPDSSFTVQARLTPSSVPLRRTLRVVGASVYPEPFTARGETLFREAECLLDDSDTLFFEAAGEPFARWAYGRVTGPFRGPFSVVVPVVRKEGLEGPFGLDIEVFFTKEGRAAQDIYDPADTLLHLPVNPGTEFSPRDYTFDFDFPGREVACLLLKLGGAGFSGSCWAGRPYLTSHSEKIEGWLGSNLSTRPWPRWRLTFGDSLCFEGNIFDRAADVADFYIPLPGDLQGDGAFTLTLLSEKPRMSYPYRLHSVEILTEPARAFELVSVPKFLSVGETAGLLIETNRPDVRLTVEFSSDGAVSPSRQELFFAEPGLHTIPVSGTAPGLAVPVVLSDGSRTVRAEIAQVVSKGFDGVCLSSGDEVYIDKRPPIYDSFFKWYVSSRVGNWYQFRPSYQWSGTRGWDLDYLERYKGLLCGLGMPYAWQVDGRTLAGDSLNPSAADLASPMFRGKQAHENDGGYNYWRHFLYEGLYSDLAARARPYGGIFAKHRPIVTERGTFIHYDPYKVSDMADGARYLVDNLRSSKGESTRHTGPSTLFRYLYQAGYEWLGAEQMYGPEELVLSSLRGASKAYSRPSFGSLHAMQWGAKPFTEPWHARLHYTSLATAYMHGSSHINTEEGLWSDELSNDRYSEAGKRHLYGQARMLDFIQTHTRRGRMVSRFAVVQGRNDAWNVCNRGSLWSQEGAKWQFNAATESFDLLKVFYPDHKLDWCSPENMFTRTPYGTVDLVPVEAPADVWKDYDVVLFLGWNSYDEADFQHLAEYVQEGGTLVLTAAHLNAGLQPDGPLRFPSDDALIRRLLGPSYRSLRGKNIIRYGEGRIVYFADRAYPAEAGLRQAYEDEIRSLAEESLSHDLETGWIKTSSGVSYTVWEHDGVRTFYMLNIGWQDGAAPASAVWSRGGKDFTVPVRRYHIETLHQRGCLAVVPSSNTTDVLSLPESADGCIVVQTTGPDMLRVMDAATGTERLVSLPGPGIHKIVAGPVR